jgi:hypothetical protein
MILMRNRKALYINDEESTSGFCARPQMLAPASRLYRAFLAGIRCAPPLLRAAAVGDTGEAGSGVARCSSPTAAVAGAAFGSDIGILQLLTIFGIHRFGSAQNSFHRDVVEACDLANKGVFLEQEVGHHTLLLVERFRSGYTRCRNIGDVWCSGVKLPASAQDLRLGEVHGILDDRCNRERVGMP